MIKILLADDHRLFRDVIVPLLNNQHDMKVVGEAGTGREAIWLSQTLHPDLILLDFGLPDGSGLQAMRSILEEQPQAKVVFLTVFAESALLLEAIRDGARGFVIKDTPFMELVHLLRGVVHGKMAVSPQLATRLRDEVAHLPSAE